MDVVSDFKYLIMLKGWVEFIDEKMIVVNGEDKYIVVKFVIVIGVIINILNIEGLNDVGYLINELLFDLEEKFDSLIIMGVGYIGLEIV